MTAIELLRLQITKLKHQIDEHKGFMRVEEERISHSQAQIERYCTAITRFEQEIGGYVNTIEMLEAMNNETQGS
jgi:chromosome segregation ATPase